MFNKTLNNALLISLAASIVALFLKLMHVRGSNELILASLPALAICAFAKNAAERTAKGFITGAVIAWAAIATMFKLLRFTNGDLMFKSAIVAGVVWLGYLYFIADKEKAGE